MKETFIGEAITPQDMSYPVAPMAMGKPGLPRTFSWKGRGFSVIEVLEEWKESGPCRHQPTKSTNSSPSCFRHGVESTRSSRKIGRACVCITVKNTPYRIVVENPNHSSRGVNLVELDGTAVPDKVVMLRDDAQPHEVRVVLGTQPPGHAR